MIYVIATVKLQENGREEFLAEFQQVAPLVLREDGCIEYRSTVDVATNISVQAEPRPNVVTIVEKWECVEALERHLVAAHMLEYRKKVKPFVLSTELQILRPIP